MSKTTRAKFTVQAKLPNLHSNGIGGRIVLAAVTGKEGEAENKTFWEATPSGLIDMHITNQSAFDSFRQNQQFYIDFTPVD
jgi:hypothetical protein